MSTGPPQQEDPFGQRRSLRNLLDPDKDSSPVEKLDETYD